MLRRKDRDSYQITKSDQGIANISELRHRRYAVMLLKDEKCSGCHVTDADDDVKSNQVFFSNNSNCQRVKRRDSFRITVMSVVVITVFLMIEVPLMVITVLHALSAKV